MSWDLNKNFQSLDQKEENFSKCRFKVSKFNLNCVIILQLYIQSRFVQVENKTKALRDLLFISPFFLSCFFLIEGIQCRIGAGDARDAAASPSKFFLRQN